MHDRRLGRTRPKAVVDRSRFRVDPNRSLYALRFCSGRVRARKIYYHQDRSRERDPDLQYVQTTLSLNTTRTTPIRGFSWQAYGPPTHPQTPRYTLRQNGSLRQTCPVQNLIPVESRRQIKAEIGAVVIMTYYFLGPRRIFLIEIAKCEIRSSEKGERRSPSSHRGGHPSNNSQNHPKIRSDFASILHSIVA